MVKHEEYRSLVRMAALAAAFCAAAAPAQACRLALILAMDVSNSVDPREDGLQRRGLANALLAPEVQDAFFVSTDPVAVFAFEWSGVYHQTPLAGWSLIASPKDLEDFSAAVARSDRQQRDFPTAMGAALAYAAYAFDDAPTCLFRTIDMAGDGENNRGFGPSEAYAAFPFDGITVNGLVVKAGGIESEEGLIPYFTREVLRGPLAFLMVAEGFEDYESAMRRKLVRELSAMVVGAMVEE